MNEQSAFRTMLLDLDKRLRPSDLDNLKYYCSNFIPARQREGITRGLNLWEVLEERDLLRPDKTDYLKTVISNALPGRGDLLSILTQFENFFTVCNQNSTATASFNRDFEVIIEKMNYRRWRVLVRILGLSDTVIDDLAERYQGNVREQLRHALALWSQGPSASKEFLVAALQRCDMNMIAHEVETS